MTNDMNYFEIGTPDPDSTRAFYGGLFDWSFAEPSMPARYATIGTNDGGLWDTSQMGAQSWAIFYVQVENVHNTIEHAERLGGTVVVPVIDNGMIEFAHLADPLGNRIGIWQRKNVA